MHFTDYDTRLAAYALVVDGDRVLLSWYNGRGRDDPAWTLPGGGVDFEETIEAAVVREVREETGYDVALGRPLLTDSWVAVDRPRPFKSVRVVYTAEVTDGELGTLEVDGTTDRAAWVFLEEVASHEQRTALVDVALQAWRQLAAES